MLIFTATTDKLQLVTENAQAVDVHASIADHTLSTDNYEAKVQNTAISSAAATDIVSAPASGDTRNLKSLFAFNNGTSMNVLTVRYNANGTTYDLFKAPVPPKGAIAFSPDKGFYLLKQSRNDLLLVTTVDHAVDDAAYRDIGELAFRAKAGKTYALFASIILSSSASGFRLGLNGPASPTYLRLAGLGTRTTSATNAALSTQGSSVSAYDTSVVGNTSAYPSVQSLNIMRGVLVPSADGRVVPRIYGSFPSTGSYLARAGSFLYVREPDNV